MDIGPMPICPQSRFTVPEQLWYWILRRFLASVPLVPSERADSETLPEKIEPLRVPCEGALLWWVGIPPGKLLQ